MATVELMFPIAFSAAMRGANRAGVRGDNARMVAMDAVEDAWAELREGGDFANWPRWAYRRALWAAVKERQSERRFLDLLSTGEDGDSYEDIGVPATQEEGVIVTAKLDEVRAALDRLDERDRQVLRCMLRGMSVLDIAKEVKRAVPMLVSDVARIRRQLNDNGVCALDAAE